MVVTETITLQSESNGKYLFGDISATNPAGTGLCPTNWPRVYLHDYDSENLTAMLV